MNATTAFGLTEIARVTVDGTEYVVYSDGVYREIMDASEYDNVPTTYHAVEVPEYDGDNDDAIDDAHRANGERYSLWCAHTSAIGDADEARRIITAAGIPAMSSAIFGRVTADE